MRTELFVALVVAILVGACGGGPSSSSSTPTSASPTSNPGTPVGPVDQTGCSATYACPNVDINGTPNPSTPTFDQLTLSKGASSTCPVVERDRSGTTEPFPIQFTIRKPDGGFGWRYDMRTDGSSYVGTMPPSGSTAPNENGRPTSDPIQVIGQAFMTRGAQAFTSVLSLGIYDLTQTKRASCGIQIFGKGGG
jgi:hypothetical protein